jgi:hypothetical protein
MNKSNFRWTPSDLSSHWPLFEIVLSTFEQDFSVQTAVVPISDEICAIEIGTETKIRKTIGVPTSYKFAFEMLGAKIKWMWQGTKTPKPLRIPAKQGSVWDDNMDGLWRTLIFHIIVRDVAVNEIATKYHRKRLKKTAKAVKAVKPQKAFPPNTRIDVLDSWLFVEYTVGQHDPMKYKCATAKLATFLPWHLSMKGSVLNSQFSVKCEH